MATLFGDKDAGTTTSSTAGTAAALLEAASSAGSASNAGATTQAQMVDLLFAPEANLLSGASSSAGTASASTHPYDWYSDISSKAA